MKQFVGKGYTVYKHTNKVNGKSYIGQTKCQDLTRRWTGGHGYEGCPYFYNAIQKYGWNGFTHEILETGLTKKEADEKEIFYIKKFRTTENDYGYNIKHGGHHDGTITEETREKFRERYSGKNAPVAKAIDIYNLNGELVATFYTLNEASKFIGCTAGSLSSKCSSKRGTLRGYICHYHETTNGMKQLPEKMIFKVNEQRGRCKAVAQYSPKGKLIAVFNSAKEAAERTGTLRTEIIACLNQKENRIASNGFIWKSGDNPPEKIDPLTDEQIENIENGTLIYSRPLVRTDVVTKAIKEFKTAREAAKEHNVTPTTIIRWAKADKPMHGYCWRYKYA